jgi:hypothetical protein
VQDDDGSYYNTALLWIVPAKVAGTWKLAQGELVLKQEFQEVAGSLRSGGETAAVSGGRLRGDAISFRIGSAHYSGRVSGNTMSGTVTSDGATSSWSAMRTP